MRMIRERPDKEKAAGAAQKLGGYTCCYNAVTLGLVWMLIPAEACVNTPAVEDRLARTLIRYGERPMECIRRRYLRSRLLVPLPSGGSPRRYSSRSEVILRTGATTAKPVPSVSVGLPSRPIETLGAGPREPHPCHPEPPDAHMPE